MKTFARAFLIGLACAAVVSPTRAGETYKIDAAHSIIGFKVHQFLGTTSGKFSQFSGTIEIDREHPERSSVMTKILVNSLTTGNQKRDDHLRSPDFFNVGKFPQMTFKSRSVKQTGAQSGDILGDLTMHGVTKPVTLHVRLTSPLKDSQLPERSRWEVTTDPLKRRDFELLFSRSAEAISGIGQEVSLRLEIEATK